jgi:hypothetical protein
MIVFNESVNQLDQSLQTQYAAMSETLNPVILELDEGSLSESELGVILGQYSILPARIIEFLSLGAERLRQWPKVKQELERNIDEELGSRTGDRSHYDILQDALRQEVKLDIADSEPTVATHRFMENVREGLLNKPEAFVAGVIYGLEASAIPELTVVARLINQYASLSGQIAPIDLTAMAQRSSQRPTKDMGVSFNLDTFFAMHLQDFEVGHRNGLVNSLKWYVAESDCQLFEAGFEHLLNEMELWWSELARPTKSPADLQPGENVSGQQEVVMLSLS